MNSELQLEREGQTRSILGRYVLDDEVGKGKGTWTMRQHLYKMEFGRAGRTGAVKFHLDVEVALGQGGTRYTFVLVLYEICIVRLQLH